MGEKRDRVAIWVVVIVLCVIAAGGVLFYLDHRKPLTITGAITVQDADPAKELPIADVTVSATDGFADMPVKSNSAGFFSIKLRRGISRGRVLTLQFRHPNYRPLDLKQSLTDKLWLVRLAPIEEPVRSATKPGTTIGNIQVKYSINTLQAVNVGSAAKTFEIKNVGNVPCNGQEPCSPDGKWKAAIASASLDAGTGNEFQNARVSCIAGPCPFAKIESDNLSQGGQSITASVRAWSDTVTFLMEAEVFHPMTGQVDRKSYPIILERALSFTLPSAAEGVTIEADVNGEDIFFPLGPALYLSWANCNVTFNRDQGKVIRCELKPGYRFQ